jgi:hypothetical protein
VMNAKYRRVCRPIVTVMLGVSDLSNMGCLSFRSRIPAAPIEASVRSAQGESRPRQRRAQRAKP